MHGGESAWMGRVQALMAVLTPLPAGVCGAVWREHLHCKVAADEAPAAPRERWEALGKVGSEEGWEALARVGVPCRLLTSAQGT